MRYIYKIYVRRSDQSFEQTTNNSSLGQQTNRNKNIKSDGDPYSGLAPHYVFKKKKGQMFVSKDPCYQGKTVVVIEVKNHG